MYESNSIIQSKISFEIQQLTHHALLRLDKANRPYLYNALRNCNYHLSRTIVNFQDSLSIQNQIILCKTFLLRIAELWSLLGQWPREIDLPGLEHWIDGVKQLYFDLLNELARKELHLIKINSNQQLN